GPPYDARRHGRLPAEEHRRLGCRVVLRKGREAGVVRLDPIEEVLVPRVAQRTAPPLASRQSTSARASSPEPLRGSVQLCACRPATIEYARSPEPAESTACAVWKDCQSRYDWT